MSKVNIGTQLDLEQLINTRLLIQANSGGGKSYAIRKILEETHGKVQQIVIDPEGEFASLREYYDYVLIGKDGDIKINMRHIETLAHKLLEHKITCIIDLSGLLREDKIKFVRLFLNAMINSPKELWHQVLVPIDEIHKFCPQTQKGSKTSVESRSAVIEFLDSGRKRGFCAILATQRISKLDKDAAAECGNKLIGRTGLTNDMRTVAEELGMNKAEMLELRQLEAGEFFCFGPALSNEVKRFKIGKTKSTHPRAGQKLTDIPPMTKAVKEELARLADIPEEAEKELKTKQDLEQRVKEQVAEIKTLKSGTIKPEKIAEIKAQAIAGAEKSFMSKVTGVQKELDKSFKSVITERDNEISRLNKIIISVTKAVGVEFKPVEFAKPDIKYSQNIPENIHTEYVKNTYYDAKPLPKPRTENKNTGFKKGVIEMLKVAAMYHPNSVTKSRIAAITGFTSSGGTFRGYLSTLNMNGLVNVNGDDITITEDGLMLIGDIPALPDNPGQLVEMWKSKFKKGIGEILQVLFEEYPSAVTKEWLGNKTGFEHTGGTFRGYLSTLNTNDLININGDTVKLSDEFYK